MNPERLSWGGACGASQGTGTPEPLHGDIKVLPPSQGPRPSWQLSQAHPRVPSPKPPADGALGPGREGASLGPGRWLTRCPWVPVSFCT